MSFIKNCKNRLFVGGAYLALINSRDHEDHVPFLVNATTDVSIQLLRET